MLESNFIGTLSRLKPTYRLIKISRQLRVNDILEKRIVPGWKNAHCDFTNDICYHHSKKQRFKFGPYCQHQRILIWFSNHSYPYSKVTQRLTKAVPPETKHFINELTRCSAIISTSRTHERHHKKIKTSVLYWLPNPYTILQSALWKCPVSIWCPFHSFVPVKWVYKPMVPFLTAVY